VGKDVSAIVRGDKPIVAERTMYFDYENKWTDGHDVLGVPEPGETWYFAEGTTRDNPTDGSFEEWLCILNPNSVAAPVEITYMLGDGSTSKANVTIQPRSRATRKVNLDVGEGKDVSIKIHSKVPVVAERPIYYKYHGTWKGGDSTAGARYPSERLYLAEGCTYSWAREWLCIQNPNAVATYVDLFYTMSGGESAFQKVTVPATSRITIDVAAAVGVNKDVSIRLESGLPVIAERSMYFDYQGKWPGGHTVTATPSPRRKVYFAEGTTRSNSTDGYFDEWLCMQNPNTRDTAATVTFYRSDGVRTIATIPLPAGARTTVLVNPILGSNIDASILVESGLPIVVERPLYFDYRGSTVGGADTFGYGL
jgi:hypothetical protein